MDRFFKNPNEKLGDLFSFNREQLLFRVLPRFMMEIMSKYFRLEIEGQENLPKKGPGIILPNHSGYAGFDAFILAHQTHQITNRTARVLTHPLWFWSKTTAIPATKLGFFEATSKNGLRFLKKKNLIILFPEGEMGNFKPTTKKYNLQEFKRGFVRMAIQTGAPIIPTVIIGAEETHINLRQLSLTKYLSGLVLPLPLNVLPLPARWKVHFLKPIYLPYHPHKSSDKDLVHEIAIDVREKMQRAVNLELKRRESIYL